MIMSAEYSVSGLIHVSFLHPLNLHFHNLVIIKTVAWLKVFHDIGARAKAYFSLWNDYTIVAVV